jgi:hypothetical protein
VKLLFGACLGLIIGGAGVALAEDPPPAAAPSSTPVPAAPTAASATSSSASPTVVVTGKRNADERRLIMAGWKEEMHDGEKVFCRDEDKVGSRLTKNHVCGSFEQIKEATQQNEDRLSEDLRHAHYQGH